MNKIQNGKISLADIKNNQEKFKWYLGEIKKESSKKRSKEQKNALDNIKMLYKARIEAIKFYDDYSSMMSDTIFMNSEDSKTSNPHVLVLKLTNKLDLRIGEKIIAL